MGTGNPLTIKLAIRKKKRKEKKSPSTSRISIMLQQKHVSSSGAVIPHAIPFLGLSLTTTEAKRGLSL
jgi:hypothetical protein